MKRRGALMCRSGLGEVSGGGPPSCSVPASHGRLPLGLGFAWWEVRGLTRRCVFSE